MVVNFSDIDKHKNENKTERRPEDEYGYNAMIASSKIEFTSSTYINIRHKKMNKILRETQTVE